MSRHRMLRLMILLVPVQMASFIGWPFAASAELKISACEPSAVQTGEMVLITLSGDFPSGELTIEFFPQRINVLSSSLIDRRTLAVQISVPLDAPAGSYNVLAYNAKGEETLGRSLLEVQRRVRVPQISSSSPTEVDAGLEEVKLTLRCDILDSDALPHLSVEWTTAGKPIEGLRNSFSRGGVNAINLTVSGVTEPGTSIGRVFFDTTPIFLIKLTRVTSDWSLFGHRPARLTADAAYADITLLGSGLSETVLAGASVRLTNDSRQTFSAPLSFLDGARALARFSPTPTAAEYALEVESNGVVVYQGPLLILPGRSAGTDQEAVPSHRGSKLTPSNSSQQLKPERNVRRKLPDWQEARAADSVGSPELKADSSTGESGEAIQDEAERDLSSMTVEHSDATEEGSQTIETDIQPIDHQPDRQLEPEQNVTLVPTAIDSNLTKVRLELHGFSAEHPDPERLQATLTLDMIEAALLFMGVGEDKLTLLFTAPEGGWPPGAMFTLQLVRRSDGEVLVELKIPVD